MLGLDSNRRRRYKPYRRQIDRTYSPFLAYAVPWMSIMFGSFLAALPVTSSIPAVPPLGLLTLLAWLLLRPGLLPIWAGFPLGLFDDLFNSQPFGFAMFTWSAIMLIVNYAENHIPWRGFYQDWAFASLLVAAYLFLGALFSGATITNFTLLGLLPQLLLSIVIYPVIARMVAWLDKIRLTRFRAID